MKPRITVGIPCYNQSQYLVECIESVLAQTEKPHEIIIVNDGSQDDTRYIAKQYQDVIYIEQVNKGLASARNTMIMNMTGDYLFPLDADDVLKENCLERVAYTIAETDADIVAPSFKEFGVRDTNIILMAHPKLEDFKTANRIGYFSAIKKERLFEIGGYNPKMIWGWEDYDLWFDLLKRGAKIVTIPEILVLYRTKERSMINEANEHASELWAQIYKNHPSIYDK